MQLSRRPSKKRMKNAGASNRMKVKIEVGYEYVPDEYSEARLTDVYSMLFDEIRDLISTENRQKETDKNKSMNNKKFDLDSRRYISS